MMNTYEVIIKATVTKAMVVSAESEDEAIDEAHDCFDLHYDSYDEKYTQEHLSVEKK